ncbi:MAG: restriction endonuclease subunit S [Bacteroides sp.]|nr:restriction endonuclease subunit S [Bacteroides sp.]
MRKDWEYKKLGEVCTIERGGSPRPITDFITNDSNGINWIKIGDTKEGSKYITSTKEKIKPEGVKKSRFVHKGDFILSNSMSFGRPYILDIDGCIHDGWLVIHDGKKFFSKDYLYYLLASPIMYSRFSQLAVGGVVNNLNSALVRKVIVPIPPISIQLSIANELDKINELIQLKKQQLKDYDQLAQSIFYEMFGDPVENEKGWEVKNIESVCSSIVRGPFGSALKKDFFVPKNNSTYKIYEQKNAIQKNASIGSYYITEERFKELSRFELLPGDIIMSCSGTIGELYRIPVNAEKGIMNQALLKFSLLKQINFLYFLYLMDYVKKEFTIRGSGLQNIGSVKIIKSMKFGLPPLPLQQQFAARIEAIERQKQQVSETIKDLETLLASRMQYWFD